MKSEISPKEYSKMLNSFELVSIELINGSSQCERKYLTEKNIELQIKENVKIEEKTETGVTFNQQYTLHGKSEGAEKPAFTIKTRYCLHFRIENQTVISEEFLKLFSEVSLKLTSWPYFREFVQNHITRMNLPPLTLPLVRV